MSLKYYLFIEGLLVLAHWVNVGSEHKLIRNFDRDLFNMESVLRGLEEN